MLGTGRSPWSAAAGRSPGLFWLSGFRSDMTGSKATAVDEFGAAHGLGVTRFDYSGHGQSGGDFNQGTISRWLEEAEAVFATTTGPQVVIGSSMGGWLALLLTPAVRRAWQRPRAGSGADRAGHRHDRADPGADAQEVSEALDKQGLSTRRPSIQPSPIASTRR